MSGDERSSMDELADLTQQDGLYDPSPMCGGGRHQPCRHCDEADALNEAMADGRPIFFVPGGKPFAGPLATPNMDETEATP